MEVFSLLKYWRTGGGGVVGETNLTSHSSHRSSHHATTTTTTTNTNSNSSVSSSTITTIREADGGDCGEESDRDEGPFFDLEFTVPVQEEQECEEEDEEGSEDEFDFTVDSSCSTGNRTDPNLSLSPSDDLFFNGRFVPLEPTEFGSESSSKLQFPGSLLKPATKLRVLMLGFKKPKPEAKANRAKASFTVKLKVEEDPVTILSLFSSSRNPTNSKISKEDAVAPEEQRKFTKDVLQKYLKMVKPLYFKVSKKSNGFSGQLNVSSSVPITSSPSKKIEGEVKEPPAAAPGTNSSNVRVLKEGNLTAGLRNVRKHLGKSRSASSAAVASVPAAAMAVQSRRHDDSLLQQQDGIQSAIMHCKRSFTASRDSDSTNPNSLSLSRCTSDPSHEKSKSITKGTNPSRISLDETRVRN